VIYTSYTSQVGSIESTFRVCEIDPGSSFLLNRVIFTKLRVVPNKLLDYSPGTTVSYNHGTQKVEFIDSALGCIPLDIKVLMYTAGYQGSSRAEKTRNHMRGDQILALALLPILLGLGILGWLTRNDPCFGRTWKDLDK